MFLVPLLMTFSLDVTAANAIDETNILFPDLADLDDEAGNWTTCDEFLNGTSFDVDSVVDVDWKIFYFWNPYDEDSYHVRFSVPSPTLVDRFRLELDKHLKPQVMWSEACLFMETSVDVSGLYIKTNTSGKFRFIPSISFQFHIGPYIELALKVIDGYLGTMACAQRFGYALAPVQNLPSPPEINKTAAKFGIANPLGRSYLTRRKQAQMFQDIYQLVAPDDDDEGPGWNTPSLSAKTMFT